VFEAWTVWSIYIKENPRFGFPDNEPGNEVTNLNLSHNFPYLISGRWRAIPNRLFHKAMLREFNIIYYFLKFNLNAKLYYM
jgi:hypothetical protein